MTDRTKTILIVSVLVQQLLAWIKHARDLGHMTGQFKYLSGILYSAADRFHRFIFDGFSSEEETIYEHSVNVSETVEKLLSLDEDDLRRVMSLVDKIKREREQGQTLKAA